MGVIEYGCAMPAVVLGYTSAVMVACEGNAVFGGDVEVELKEPCANGLFDKFEGLVLFGLGPPAMSSLLEAEEKGFGYGQY
jgi:hypothetical protein